MMTAVFACQGLGQYTAALVPLLCTVGFRNSLQTEQCTAESGCIAALDKSWRLLYAYGIIPACIALYFRLTIPESVHFQLDVLNDPSGALADARWYIDGRSGSAPRGPRGSKASGWMGGFEHLGENFRDFRRHFEYPEKWKELLGTAASWFFLDIAYV